MPLKTTILTATILLTILATPTRAYELYLDIDTDNDPATINDFTWDSSCTVRLVLVPSYPEEEIWSVDFGLGGSCLDCGGVFNYGTGHDLGDMQTWTWQPHAYFAGTWESATMLDCPAATGFHDVYHAESIVDCCFVPGEPVFFGTFRAWTADTPGGCAVPSNLAIMHEQGVDGVWNYIQIGEPAVGGNKRSWSAIKSLYR